MQHVHFSSTQMHPARILQVQTLGLTLCLRLHDSLPRRSEVCHLHPHASLSQRHQASFRTYGFDVSSGEVILLVDELIKVDILVERHLRGVKSKNFSLRVFWY